MLSANLPVHPGAIAELLRTLAIDADTEEILDSSELSARSWVAVGFGADVVCCASTPLARVDVKNTRYV